MRARGDSVAVERVIPRVSDYCRPEYGPGGGFGSVDDIERANANAGAHFFSADTKRFFGSRIGSTLYGGRFFVTSEYDGFEHTGRSYSVRFVRVDASIETLWAFGGFATSARANRAAARAAHLYALRAGYVRCGYCGWVAKVGGHLATARTAAGYDLERFETIHGGGS